MADSLSADAAASSNVRKQLRQRARYELANNSYAKGIVLTLANDCVGTGPRLQVLTPDNCLNNTIESAFGLWSQQIQLASKLRTALTPVVFAGIALAAIGVALVVRGPARG